MLPQPTKTLTAPALLLLLLHCGVKSSTVSGKQQTAQRMQTGANTKGFRGG